MTPSTRLGGFKILKGMARFSLVLPERTKNLPARFCRAIAEKEINLPYFTCLNNRNAWRVNILVDAAHGLRVSLLINENFTEIFNQASESAILSIFPHKKNPEIMGSLFEVFGENRVEPDALANSPSAISVVLKEEHLSKASDALFVPFSFSAYRTPDDWQLAQKGKEQLYREVVASYQEQRPKVYGLEYQDGQELVFIRLSNHSIGDFGAVFKEFASLGLNLTFSSISPCNEEGKEILAFCLPASEIRSHTVMIKNQVPDTEIDSASPVGIFSMNGPHFGDRYGIASELLTAFDKDQINLLGLSCTIASITGIVPSAQLVSSIQTIQDCFEVPTVIKKDD